MEEQNKPEKKVTPQNLVDTYYMDQKRLEALQKRQQEMQQILTEVSLTTETLKEIKKTKKDESIMVSLGAGVFAEAKITNTSAIKISLAGNVLADKKIDEAITKLAKEKNAAEKEMEKMRAERDKITQNMQAVSNLLEKARQIQQAPKNTEANNVS